MKNLISKIVLTMTILFLSYEVYAVCPTPLSWDYPTYSYNGEFSATVTLSYNPSCILRYTYCWRTTPCCFDFAITKVSLEGDCDNFKNVDTLIKYATRDLVANKNPWRTTIPECPEQSSGFWRQSTAACFSDFYWDPVTLQWVSVPCGDDGQERYCWSYYQYCWTYVNEMKYLQETLVERMFGGPPCPTTTGTASGLGCNQRCQ